MDELRRRRSAVAELVGAEEDVAEEAPATVPALDEDIVARPPTLAGLTRTIAAVHQSGGEAEIIITYSGHGAVGPRTKEPRLMAPEARVRYPECLDIFPRHGESNTCR